MNAEMDRKLKALLENEAFCEKLSGTVNNEAAFLELLASEGIEMTAEEWHGCLSAGKKLLEEKGLMVNGELTEEALEMVAGGRKWGVMLLGLGIGLASAYVGYPDGVIIGAGMIVLGWCSK